MIVGIGTDIVDLARIEKILDRSPRFIERILTEEEKRSIPFEKRRKAEYIGGRFAAKEAFAKALGVGIGKALGWHDISIMNNHQGKPEVHFSNPRFLEGEWKKRTIHLSISHERHTIIAFVVIEES